MKKFIILIVIAAVVGGLWWWGSSRRSVLEDEGELARGESGCVEVPISASGEARERQRVEVKAEASGTILEIPVSEGDVVEPGQLLLRIDEEEEQRNVEKAQAAVDQAEESVEIAKLAHEQAKEDETFNVELAQAAFDTAQARFNFAEFEYNRYKGFEQDARAASEMQQKLTQYVTAKSDLARARVDLARAKDAGPRNVRRTSREIGLANARLRSAKHTFSDAQRRLRKTKVANNYPSACRVVRIYASEGQVVSSAVNVVGGTTLMELADISVMEVEAQVDESDVDKVVGMMADGNEERQEGRPTSAPSDDDSDTRFRDEVAVEFDALPRESFVGRIIEIAQKPRNLAQIITYDVRIRLYDDPRLKSVRLGMQGTVEFSPVLEEGLCIPYEAVHRRGRDDYVVKMPDPTDSRGDPIEREIDVGLTDGSRVIVRSGLAQDEDFYVKLPTRIKQDAD